MKKHLPNIITLCNLLCGVIATYSAIKGHILYASLFILLGIFFDFFDGLTARLLNVALAIGKELDSLADVITSGVAPGFILFEILSSTTCCEQIKWIALLMPAFSAYRLAKFNLDERQHHSFIGLPTPANALIWVGIGLMTANDTALLGDGWKIALSIISIATDLLLISELAMFSLKFDFHRMDWKSNRTRYIFLTGSIIIIVATVLFAAQPSHIFGCMPLIIIWYIILSIMDRPKERCND